MRMPIVILLLSVCSLAAPGATTMHLMNEPASLFDVGMIRLELWGHRMGDYVKKIYSEHAKTDVHDLIVETRPFYSDDDDKIRILFKIYDDHASHGDMEAGCRAVLRQMVRATHNSMWQLFAHAENEVRLKDSSLMQDLYTRVELSCSTIPSNSPAYIWANVSLDTDLKNPDIQPSEETY